MNPLAESLANALVESTSLTNDEVRAIVASPEFGRINELLDRLDAPDVTQDEVTELDLLVTAALADRYDSVWNSPSS